MSADSVESAIEDRAAQLILQPLHPELFKPASVVTQDHVLSAFGNVTVGLPRDVIASLVDRVQGIKADVRSWGLHQVRAKIVKNFNQVSPGGSFATITQIANYWSQNGTVEAAGKLWYACYGAFDDEPGWDLKLEQMYMEKYEYTYRVTEDGRKGCFARTIGQRKTDIIKMINRASEKTHHGLIRLKRLSGEIDEKTKFKKRKKGTTLGGFVKLDGQVKYEPELVATSVKQKIDEEKIAELAEVIDPQFVANDKRRQSPRNKSQEAASPSPQKESPPTARRTNTARSFEEKEEVSKYKKKFEEHKKRFEEQKRENAKQRRVIDELASRKKQEEKEAETARNKETLKKSGGSTKPKKKKKTSKKQQLEQTVEGEVDDHDGLEKCTIIKHKTNRQGMVTMEVKWEGSGVKNWQFLYDMWADYPGKVMEYKKKKIKKCKGTAWNVPTIDGVQSFVRILGMLGGEDKVTDAVFIVLADNGYKFEGKDCVKYDELQHDDEELLKAFLESLKDSPEADDASIA